LTFAQAAVQARDATDPEVVIERGPKPRVLEIAAQVSFKGADRCFGLWLGNRNVEEPVVGSVEPYARIPTEHPMTQALGIAELRLESPAVNTSVD
jgi:hypothetical protein